MTTDGPRRRPRTRRVPGQAPGNPPKLGATLERFLSQMGAPPVQTLGDLQQRWSEIVGPALSEHSRPISVVDGVLTVACGDASWASQIGWMDHQIKDRCLTVYDGLVITRIHVRVGRLPEL